MRLLCCGGRDHADTLHVFGELDRIHAEVPITTLIHGAAQGADTLGAVWATLAGVPVEAYPADWTLHGRAAGPIRNRKMLAEGKPDTVLAAPGGVGTADMIAISRQAGVYVVELPAPPAPLSTRVLVQSARISYGGPGRLDVSRQGNDPTGKVFAPSWEILRPALDERKRAQEAAKAGDAAEARRIEDAMWSAYVPAYVKEMRASYKRHFGTWERVLSAQEVTLCCMCVSSWHCHRFVLSGLLGRLGARVLGERRETDRG